MKMRVNRLAAMVAGAFVAGSVAASAAPMVAFDVNPGSGPGVNSSVTLSNINAAVGTFTPTAAIAIPDPTTFSLGTGDTATFDFITFDVGAPFCALCSFDIAATLVFDLPGGSVSGSGSGGAAFALAGAYVGGYLQWDTSSIPASFFFGGSEFLVDFEGGKTLLSSSTTTWASVTGVNVVPLPAAGLLLIGGLGGLGFMSRKRKAA